MRKYRIRKFPTKLVITALIIAILIAFNPRGIKNFVFGIIAKPLQAVSGGREIFLNPVKLQDENIALKQRLASLSIELARMEEIASENERLKRLLKFQGSLNYDTIPAKVIGRDSTDWRSSVIINKGKADGVVEHMPCATNKGIIGSVSEVGETSSKVMLITDLNSRVGVVLASSRESGVLTGAPGGICRIKYLSLDEDIKIGEKVLTAGFSAFFPQGIPVGEIKEIGTERNNLYRYALVKPLEDMNKIEEIICIDTENKKK